MLTFVVPPQAHHHPWDLYVRDCCTSSAKFRALLGVPPLKVGEHPLEARQRRTVVQMANALPAIYMWLLEQ